MLQLTNLPMPAVVDKTVVSLAGLGTALPPHQLSQSHFDRLAPAFENAGVDTRYLVQPVSWYERDHSWSERGSAYLETAPDLFIHAARSALADAGVAAEDVDVIVTVSSTGIATPSLEAQAFKAMGFRNDVQRVPVW